VEAERLFICADGEAGQLLGNLTVRWHPDEHWLELRLPKALEQPRQSSRWPIRLSCPVVFAYRGEEVAAQAESGAVRYDVFFDRASTAGISTPRVVLRRRASPGHGAPALGPVIAVDLNHGHLAVCVLDPSGTRSERR